MQTRASSRFLAGFCAALAISHAALADDAACNAIDAANAKSYSSGVSANTKITKTGVDFAKATPKIYSQYTKLICVHIQDEDSNGEPASLYTQQYESPAGNTTAKIWISRKTGLLLREELDGDLGPKGKGHESMIFSYTK
jgi:hypothetical protein